MLFFKNLCVLNLDFSAVLLMKFVPLQKEENVLAQEAVLEALLSSESQHEEWMWDKENQTGGVRHFDSLSTEK